jgi:hypothetical protein
MSLLDPAPNKGLQATANSVRSSVVPALRCACILAFGRNSRVASSGRVAQSHLLVNGVGVAVSPWGSRDCCGQVTGWFTALCMVTHSAQHSFSSDWRAASARKERTGRQRLKLTVGRGRLTSMTGTLSMIQDRSFVGRNRASTERIRRLVADLSDPELQRPVGQHWTVAIALAHLAFWDRRVLYVLDLKEQGRTAPEVDVSVNDLSLSLWAAIPPRQAVRLALETAEALDARLERYPSERLADIFSQNQRWVIRALHRNEHLDEIEAALKP